VFNVSSLKIKQKEQKTLITCWYWRTRGSL